MSLVVQRRLSVMHVQSCCFANINLWIFNCSRCRRRHDRYLNSLLFPSRWYTSPLYYLWFTVSLVHHNDSESLWLPLERERMSYQVRLWTFVIKYELCLASDVSKYLIKQSYPCINVTALVESKWWSKEPNRTLNICSILTLGRTRKFITPSCLQGRGGGGWWWNPPQSFRYVAAFRNDFAFIGRSNGTSLNSSHNWLWKQ